MTTQSNNDNLTLSYDAPLEMAPEGRHPLLCVDVFETWPEEETWDGKTKTYRKIMFVFQVFPEDGSRDSEGDVYRIEYKVNFSFAPAGPNTSASRLWTFSENWRGESFSTKSAKFNPADMIGKAAWGTLEQKTRYVQVTAIEPYVDDAGNPLLAPKAEAYKRRTYPNPEIWKNKKDQAQSTSQPSTQPTSLGSKINGSTDPSDLVPF